MASSFNTAASSPAIAGLSPDPAPAVGILAIQGGFEAHRRAFAAIGVAAREVRTAVELMTVDALVLPGGESTTVMRAIERDALGDPIAEFVRSGKPVLGTCAGAIVLDRDHLGLLDIHCERNAYGRQIASFEAEVVLEGCGDEPFRSVFIRAPKITETGDRTEILATYAGTPVLVREGRLVAATFHPELAGDQRVHALFSSLIGLAGRAETGSER